MNVAIVSHGRVLFGRANAEKLELRRAQLRVEVEARYESVLKSAGFWSRWIIRRKIRKEVSALLRAGLPSDYALFGHR
jgi:hypothetical protein